MPDHDTTLKPYQKQSIALLLKIFGMLGDLYVLFAELFPEDAEIWQELASNEHKHLDWLGQLLLSAEKGLVIFSEGKIKTYTLEAFLAYLTGIMTQAENGEMSLAQAKTLACDLENSLIIRRVFDHFDAPSPAIKAIITRMQYAAEHHHRRVLASLPCCSAS